MMTTEDAFIGKIAGTDFARDYYAFCAAFVSDLPFTKLRPRRADIAACLDALGHTMARSQADGAFTKTQVIGDRSVNQGFGFQSTGNLECFFWWRLSDGRTIGDNFCVIARDVCLYSDLQRVDPPYPRPQYCGPERLFEMLQEWSRLTDVIRAAVGLSAAGTPKM